MRKQIYVGGWISVSASSSCVFWSFVSPPPFFVFLSLVCSHPPLFFICSLSTCCSHVTYHNFHHSFCPSFTCSSLHLVLVHFTVQDRNLYITPARRTSAKFQKLASMTHSVMFHSSTYMLAAIADGHFTVWYYPKYVCIFIYLSIYLPIFISMCWYLLCACLPFVCIRIRALV